MENNMVNLKDLSGSFLTKKLKILINIQDEYTRKYNFYRNKLNELDIDIRKINIEIEKGME